MHDIIFISYGEPNADENYNDLFKRFNVKGVFGDRVKRIDGVKGIHQAHIEAAKKASTRYFYVVDGDAVITKEFNFGARNPFNQRKYKGFIVFLKDYLNDCLPHK